MQPDTWLAHRHSADPSREERRTPPFLQPDPSQYLPLPSLSERSTGGWFGGSNWWARRTDLERTVEAQAAELAALRSKVCKLEGVARSPLPPPPPLASAYTNTKPQLLPKRPLDRIEGLIDERIRTLCLVGVLCAVVYFALYHLAGTLIPFFLAVSLKYILTPLIDVLSCRHPLCESGRPRPWWLVELPRKWAVLFALAIALFVLFVVGLTVANSLSAFASRAGVYNERIDELIDWFFHKLTEVQIDLGVINATDHSGERQIENIDLLKNAVVEKIDASELIISFLGTATSVLENVLYVMLFLVFMLLEGDDRRDRRLTRTERHAERQIFAYISGKILLSLFVGIAHAAILGYAGLDLSLSLVFGLMTFWLNFIPAVGAPIGVLLPMPFIVLDTETFTDYDMLLAFLAPMLLAFLNKDVIETKVFASSTNLDSVGVMLSILLWGSVWGITGMVLAVPITAVFRIHLEHIQHPLPRYLAGKLGKSTAMPRDSASARARETEVDVAAVGPARQSTHTPVARPGGGDELL
uniref:AI-2E family transporter n=2 Tax=Emiliania huxleyi TaxID=2903 RepID=A0A6V2MUM4_EMIHU|mmetsp:Transcript_35682/g.105820  ORF Transcript_35682/g.105820 Transcript_35682/m.105820 type:complete len:527 (-) Transcript_35682:70-1650(-)